MTAAAESASDGGAVGERRRRRWRAMTVGGSGVRSVGGAGRPRAASMVVERRRSAAVVVVGGGLTRSGVTRRPAALRAAGGASGTYALAPRHESATTARLLAALQTSLRRGGLRAAAERHRHARDIPRWRAARSVEPARAGGARRRSARPPRSHLPSREAHRAQESNVRVRWVRGDGRRSSTRRGYGACAAGKRRAI